ncbi:FUSC family protein [Streptomyces sp. NBC_00503]|uniref:FUSC family protein n=1 Tax=Streptomyces sp. NBC_00503 TaxID=2903659 RepID=UPI002E80165E|nr:FUSC family protein [Streptomyces sp. NBC_00503]WUD79582.1 FUSC family protein [Streptomyces sp. NBC_00503]
MSGSVEPVRPRRADRVREIVSAEGPAAARIVVTVAVAWQVALWLGADQPPVYAAIVPLVALRSDPMTAVGASLQRVLGVVAGVLLGMAVLAVLHLSTAALALVVALGLGLGMALRAGGGLNIQVAASSLLVFASDSPDSYAFHRVWETGAGAVVTVLLAPLLWPADPVRVLSRIADDCRTHLVHALRGTVAVLGTDPAAARDNLTLVGSHTEAVRAAAARARQAEQAIRFNPLHRRDRDAVRLLARAVATADALAVHVSTLAREVAVFTGREDLAPVLARSTDRLPVVVSATVRAIGQTLGGADPRDAVTGARTELAAYAHEDPRPAAVALRRPFQLILDDLEPPALPGA